MFVTREIQKPFFDETSALDDFERVDFSKTKTGIPAVGGVCNVLIH